MSHSAVLPAQPLAAQQLAVLCRTYEAAPPEELLRWAVDNYAPDLILACSFGAEDVVLVDLLARACPCPKVFYLDTEFLFPETYQVRDRILERYNLELIRCAAALTPEQQERQRGPELWKRAPDECCHIRKVEPLKKTLRSQRAWITGIRRQQAPTRAHAQLIEWDHKFGLLKLNPLAAWTSEQVWQYIRANHVPYNALHDRNYPSIGCTHCTRPVQPGEDPRAGRWSGSAKTECGLHSPAPARAAQPSSPPPSSLAVSAARAKPAAATPVPFHRADVGEEEVAAVSEVIRSGWLTMGARTFEFERRFADYVGARYAIAVNSGTAALHLALVLAGIVSGDEVLVPANTFTASAEVVTYLGARPVLADINSKSMNLDPQDACRRITSRTRAIIPVHFAGQPCDMDAIRSLAAAHDLAIIEDAAHALPASYDGRRIGSAGALTAFSFYATKTLVTGEGGMLTTQDEALASRARLLRLHGISQDAWQRYSGKGSWQYRVEEAGYKYNLTDIAAALGLVQLSKCDAGRAARARLAQRYSAAFAGHPALEPPEIAPRCESAWHLYVLRLRLERLRIGRDEFIEQLRERQVHASVHFIPLHLQPFYQRAYGYRTGDLPVAEREFARSLSLPVYPAMTGAQSEQVTAAVLGLAQENLR